MRPRTRDLLGLPALAFLLLLAASLALAVPPEEGEFGPGEGPPGLEDPPGEELPDTEEPEPPSGPLPEPSVACPAGIAGLTSAEVNALATAAAGSFPGAFTVAVVDRGGAVLALFQKPGTPPGSTAMAPGRWFGAAPGAWSSKGWGLPV